MFHTVEYKNPYISSVTALLVRASLHKTAQRACRDIFHLEDIQMTCRYTKLGTRSIIIRKMQIKTTAWCHLTPARIKGERDKHRQDYREKGAPVHCWWECKSLQPFWKNDIIRLYVCKKFSKSSRLTFWGLTDYFRLGGHRNTLWDDHI